MAKRNALMHAVSAARTPSPKIDEAPASRQGRYKDPTYKTLSVYIPKELHTRVKMGAVEDGIELSALVEQVLKDWLAARLSNR